jgi:type IV pilus assembly protein PilA
MKQVQKGFTLIELMIVVAIIGILAAIAIPAYSDYVTRSKWSDTISSVASLKTAIGECLDNNSGNAAVCNEVTDAELGQYGAEALQASKYLTAAPTLTASAGISMVGGAELGNCTFVLTPSDKGNFTAWTPVTAGGAACYKFVKGSSSAAF